MVESIMNLMRPWTSKDYKYFCDCDTKEKHDERIRIIMSSNRHFSGKLIMMLCPHMGNFAGNNFWTIGLAEAMKERNRQLINPLYRIIKPFTKK